MKKLILSLVVLMSLTITNCSKSEENATNPKEENPSNPQNPQAPQQPPTPPQPQAPRQTQEPPISSADFTLSPDGKTLVRWNNTTRTTLDMKSHPLLNQVTTIGSSAFENCYKLKTIIFPETLTTIKSNAFSRSGLESVTIPETVTSIEDYAFYACNSLVSASIPKSANTLGTLIFRNSIKLKEVTYGPPIVKSNLFIGCIRLEKVTLLEGVTTLDFEAFYNLPNLREIHFASTTKTIEHSAFSGSGLESIVIPETITSIGDYAFSNCNRLVSASVPKSANTLGTLIFRNSIRLKEVTYGPTIVKSDLFIGCTSLEKVTLLEGVNTIDFQAFRNLRNLTNLILKATTPPTLNSNAFYNTGLTHIYVPATSVDIYKSDREWRVFANKIQAIP